MKPLYSILLRSYITVSLIPLLILGAFLSFWIYDEQVAASTMYEKGKASHVALLVKQQFSILEDKLADLNHYRELSELNDKQTKQLLREFISRTPMVRSLMILDPTGKAESGSFSDRIYTDGSTSEHTTAVFKKVISLKMVCYGPTHNAPLSGIPLITVGTPLFDRYTGKISLVVIADLSLSAIWDQVTKDNDPIKGHILWTDMDGRILAHPNPSAVLTEVRLKNLQDRLRRDLDGNLVISANSVFNLGGRSYRIISETDALTALKPAISSTGTALMVTMLAAALVAIATLRSTRRISKPVKSLTEKSRIIKEKGYFTKTTVTGFKEIEELSSAFNSMTFNLQSTLEELQESEERFRTLHNASFGAIAIHDHGMIVDCNQGLAEISGFELKELIGSDLALLMDEGSRPLVRGNFSEIFNEPVEGRGLRKDGTVYPVQMQAKKIPSKGRMIEVIEFRDITARKHAEEFMIQNEKMMSVGGLAAGMAHEINNPLAAIIGSVQNLQNRLLKETTRNKEIAGELGIEFRDISSYIKARDCDKIISTIYESSNRAAKIVKDMLSFSRKNDHIFAKVNLGDLMDRTISLVSNDYDLKKNYDFRKIRIKRNYDPEAYDILCCPNQIQQVFFNLISNSAHAMAEKIYSEGGPCITIKRFDSEGMGIIEVEDNGPGLDEESRKRIFEPFFSTKPPGEGTGLGLSISYFIIVKQHSGSIEVSSTPGEYTRFTIRLPISH